MIETRGEDCQGTEFAAARVVVARRYRAASYRCLTSHKPKANLKILMVTAIARFSSLRFFAYVWNQDPSSAAVWRS
jgi:hypothetical protein